MKAPQQTLAEQQLQHRQQLYQTIAAIPHGKVATLAGQAGAARWVGWCLRHLPKDSSLPWHRVITASGKLAFPVATAGYVRQREKLEQEGVRLKNHKVSMQHYQWRP
jgi:methylated-DNA-protein-cysteine methyltransferase-like protein